MKTLAYLVCSHNDSQPLESTHYQFSLHLQRGCQAEGTDCWYALQGWKILRKYSLNGFKIYITTFNSNMYIFNPLNLHATTVFFTTINFLTCKTKHNPNEKKKNLIINHLTESIGIL